MVSTDDVDVALTVVASEVRLEFVGLRLGIFGVELANDPWVVVPCGFRGERNVLGARTACKIGVFKV